VGGEFRPVRQDHVGEEALVAAHEGGGDEGGGEQHSLRG